MDKLTLHSAPLPVDPFLDALLSKFLASEHNLHVLKLPEPIPKLDL
jgi:hypothetical protein